MSSSIEPTADLATVLCFGCGHAPEEGRVHPLADGSGCPTCAARLVEAQPGLLRQPEADAEESEVTEEESERTEQEEPVAATYEAGPAAALPSLRGHRAGAERFRLLAGGGGVHEPVAGPVPILDPGPDEPA